MIVGQNGYTSLHKAALNDMNDSLEIAELLLKAGASADAKDKV